MLEAIKNNPVRVMAVLTAMVALAAYYLPALPVALILAIPAAILGVGEGTRALVTPVRKIEAERVARNERIASLLSSSSYEPSKDSPVKQDDWTVQYGGPQSP